MKVLVELPDADVRALDTLAHRERVPRTQLLQRAVANFLERQRALPAEAFGAWQARDAMGDGLTCERGMREKW